MPTVETIDAASANIYSLLVNDYLVATPDSIRALEEVYA